MIGIQLEFNKDIHPKVLISVPNLQWVHKNVSFALLHIMQEEMMLRRLGGTIIEPTNVPYENNLHHIVKFFRENNFDFWINIDADNPPLRNICNLILLDKDIIGCPTPVWYPTEEGRPYYWNAYKHVPEEDAYTEYSAKEGLQQVDAIGTGCFVIAKRVFQNEDMCKAPFQRKCNEDGTVEYGTDIAFCRRATANGFNIFAHFEYPCAHFNTINLMKMIKGFIK